MVGLLQDWENKNIYTMTYIIINDKEDIKDTITEKVLAYDCKDAEQLIKDYYKGPDIKIEFSQYNPINIEDLELFIADKLDEANIIRRGRSFRNR